MLIALSGTDQAIATQEARATSVRYHVVLGSYVHRKVALRELQRFSACMAPLFIEVQPNDHYRLQYGPISGFKKATAARNLWVECGAEDAWVVQSRTASDSDTSAEVSETEG